MRELSAKLTEGENPAIRAMDSQHGFSPSVKTFGFATSLVRGRQGSVLCCYCE